MSNIVEARVRLHDRDVGILLFERGGSSFIYEDDLTSPAHHTLGQTFEDEPRRRREVSVGLPPWFENLLPEGELRRQIIREMGGGHVRDFTLLLRLGSDLPGAVTVHSTAELGDDQIEDDEPGLQQPDHPIRHSLAGVQLKYSIHGDHLTFPASGDGAWWIAKLPDRSLKDLSLNEYLTMRWLKAAGMNVPRTQLVPASSIDGIPDGLVDPNERVYLIERFDRSVGGRIHTEDFAQVADVGAKFKYNDSGVTYDSMGNAINGLLGTSGYLEYVERLVAMLVVGNTDAHLKNWALIYADGRSPALSPIYDFHSLTVYTRYRYVPLALSFNGEGMATAIDDDCFRMLAEHSGFDAERTLDTVHEAVNRLRSAWSGELRTETEATFPALARHFASRLDTLPICGAC